MPTTPDTTAVLAHELRETLGRLVRRARAEPGLPTGRLAVLGRLDREGARSVSELAAAERMRPQSMAQIVAELEQAQMVFRRPDPDDRRRAFVELTAAGLAALHDNRARRESWLAAAMRSELDEAERDQLARALDLFDRIAAA